MLTWGAFKEFVERNGVKDDTDVLYIDITGSDFDNGCGLEVVPGDGEEPDEVRIWN